MILVVVERNDVAFRQEKDRFLFDLRFAHSNWRCSTCEKLVSSRQAITPSMTLYVARGEGGLPYERGGDARREFELNP